MALFHLQCIIYVRIYLTISPLHIIIYRMTLCHLLSSSLCVYVSIDVPTCVDYECTVYYNASPTDVSASMETLCLRSTSAWTGGSILTAWLPSICTRSVSTLYRSMTLWHLCAYIPSPMVVLYYRIASVYAIVSCDSCCSHLSLPSLR